MWFTVVLFIQIFVILAMIAAVLLQRSEGGALGMGGGGGGGGGGGLMTSRGAGSALTRATAVLAGMFFVCSISLAVLARSTTDNGLDFSADTDAPGQTETADPDILFPPVSLDEVPAGEADADAAADDDSPQIPD